MPPFWRLVLRTQRRTADVSVNPVRYQHWGFGHRERGTSNLKIAYGSTLTVWICAMLYFLYDKEFAKKVFKGAIPEIESEIDEGTYAGTT